MALCGAERLAAPGVGGACSAVSEGQQPVNIRIERLQPQDAEQLFRLRRTALLEERFAFLSSPEDDLAASTAAVRDQLSTTADHAAVFGAFDGEELIGMVGLTRNRPIKAAHRACIWGVYVKPEYRKKGTGAQLLGATVEHARQMDGVALVYLSVSEKTPNAKRLYEAVGFVVWGLEPDCIRYAGESASEYHLALRL